MIFSGFVPRGQTWGDYVAVGFADSQGGASLFGCIGVDGRPQLEYLAMLKKKLPASTAIDVLRKLSVGVKRLINAW